MGLQGYGEEIVLVKIVKKHEDLMKLIVQLISVYKK